MDKIHWAPKIRQARIWQLYQNDAAGLVDDSLVSEVGFSLLQRCQSIVLATHRQVECPRCGAVMEMCEPGNWRYLQGTLPCPTPGCGWETTAEIWHESWRHKDLLGLAAMETIGTYLQDYSRAKNSRERMVCIDQLIHAFHIGLLTHKAGRSFANNLIEGSHDQVVALLDRLFAKPDGVSKDEWRKEVGKMYDRRRGKMDSISE